MKGYNIIWLYNEIGANLGQGIKVSLSKLLSLSIIIFLLALVNVVMNILLTDQLEKD